MINLKTNHQSLDMKKKENFFKNNRLNSAREKYSEDNFDFEDYQLSKKERKKKIDSLEKHLQNQNLPIK